MSELLFPEQTFLTASAPAAKITARSCIDDAGRKDAESASIPRLAP
jgi:hypothetical protein